MNDKIKSNFEKNEDQDKVKFKGKALGRYSLFLFVYMRLMGASQGRNCLDKTFLIILLI